MNEENYFNEKSCKKFNIIPYKEYLHKEDNSKWKVINVTKFYVHLSKPGYTYGCKTKEFNNIFKNDDK